MDPSPASGGGIVAYGDAFIAANGVGDFLWLRAAGKVFASEPMLLPRPIDRAAFVADNSEAFDSQHFRVMDLLVDSTTTPHRLLASHYFWDPGERCIAMQISAIPIPEPGSEASAEWEPVYTTRPCVPVERATVTEGLTNHATGRMAWAPDGTLFYSVGDLSVVGPGVGALFPQDPDSDYGKVLALDSGRRGGALQHRASGPRRVTRHSGRYDLGDRTWAYGWPPQYELRMASRLIRERAGRAQLGVFRSNVRPRKVSGAYVQLGALGGDLESDRGARERIPGLGR